MPFSAFVPAVAPLSTGKQTAFLNGLRPRAARNAVCAPSRRSIIRAAVPLEVEESTFDSEVLGSVRSDVATRAWSRRLRKF